MKQIFFTILFLMCFSSCSGKTVQTDKNTIRFWDEKLLPDYSYKGYEIHPFAYDDYIMPVNIGDEWLVLYEKIRKLLKP